MEKTIGVFGCTADPFTAAHKAIVQKVLADKLADNVLVVPTAVTWHRSGKTSWLTDEQRLCVAKTMLADVASAEVLDMEIALKTAAAKSPYAMQRLEQRHFCDTLLEIAAHAPAGSKIRPVFGQDSYDALKTWEGWEAIADLSDRIIVVRRGGCGEFIQQDGLPAEVVELPDSGLAGMSATAIREAWAGRGVEAYLESIVSGSQQ